MERRLLAAIVLIFISVPAFGQGYRTGALASGGAPLPLWIGILDPTRAINWNQNVGNTPQPYSVACATQPTILAGPGNAAANAISITASFNSCDATHNVVNFPCSTFFSAGLNYNRVNNVVGRGCGANSTRIMITHPSAACEYGVPYAVCMAGYNTDASSGNFQPGTGGQQCRFTGTNGVVGTYTQGATSLILNNCGGFPPAGALLMLDQANNPSDNGGPSSCDTFGAYACTQKGNISQNSTGRVIGGVQYAQQQLTKILTVSGSGTGPYTITIPAPGLYFPFFTSSQTPGAWWPATQATNMGLEEVTIDLSGDTTDNNGIVMAWCDSCWTKGIETFTTANGGALRDHYYLNFVYRGLITQGYIYGEATSGSQSYGIQPIESSAVEISSIIFQNVVGPLVADAWTGNVFAYNFTALINSNGTFLQGSYPAHNSGPSYSLVEGNQSTGGFFQDDVWGTSFLNTYFRNQVLGWQSGYTQQTFPQSMAAGVRLINSIGNVYGEPGYHTQYEAYATSTTAGVHTFAPGGSTTPGPGSINLSIFENGWSDNTGLGVCTTPPVCDPLTHTTMMRWGNYDTVTATVNFNSGEASPGSVAFINANSVPGSHTLPSSFYATAKPSYFGALAWPPIDVNNTGGNVGICSGGSFSGSWAPNSGACTGGSFTASAWGGHANFNPPANCYLVVLSGPPDGSGAALPFNRAGCYP